jgi:catechol 2,3-dioxygenase-like lactoylglutathione lyase family enzyme
MSNMKIQAAYPLITTMNLQATRDFYVEHFGLEVIFEASWVVMLGRSAGEISLASWRLIIRPILPAPKSSTAAA